MVDKLLSRPVFEALCSGCELGLTSTLAGRIRHRFVGKARHRGVVRLALRTMEELRPVTTAETRYARERIEYDVHKAYGMAWWIMPLMSIIIEAIKWWLANRNRSK